MLGVSIEIRDSETQEYARCYRHKETKINMMGEKDFGGGGVV